MKASLFPPNRHAYSRPIVYITFKSRYNTVYGFVFIVVLQSITVLGNFSRNSRSSIILLCQNFEYMVRCTSTVGVQVYAQYFFAGKRRPTTVAENRQLLLEIKTRRSIRASLFMLDVRLSYSRTRETYKVVFLWIIRAKHTYCHLYKRNFPASYFRYVSRTTICQLNYVLLSLLLLLLLLSLLCFDRKNVLTATLFVTKINHRNLPSKGERKKSLRKNALHITHAPQNNT